MEQYEIISITPRQATDNNPCTHVKYEVLATDQVSEQLNPLENQVNTSGNPYTFEVARNSIGRALYLEVQFNTGSGLEHDTLLFFAVREIVINTVDITYMPSGATAEISTVDPAVNGQTLEYSIDGINYGTSRTFSGLAEGNYTAYVRDNLGCEKTRPFVVQEGISQGFTLQPLIEVPLLNSIRYAKVEQGLRNQDNELSHQQRNDILYSCFSQLFYNDDIVKTQFRSNYAFNRVLVTRDDITTTITPTQLSSNINRVDVRDGNVVSKDGNMAVFFSGGNTYDEDGNVNGSNNLNGNLLNSHIEGSFIDVDGVGFVRILSVEQDLNYQNFFVMTLNTPFDGNDEIRRITTIFNAHDYEIFEFINVFSQDGCYKITIQSGDDGQTAEDRFTSEYIIPITDGQFTHRIDYYNTVNNDINFGTGYRGVKIVPYEVLPVYSPKDDADTYRTDTSVRLLEANVDEIYEFDFQPMPLGLTRSLELALSVDKVFIDNLAYIKETTPEIKRIGVSNLYTFKVKMSRTEGVNTNSNFGIADSDVTGFVGNGNTTSDGGSGYVRLN